MDNQEGAKKAPGSVASKVRYFSGDDDPVTTPRGTNPGERNRDPAQDQGQGNIVSASNINSGDSSRQTRKGSKSTFTTTRSGKTNEVDSTPDYPCDQCSQVGDPLIQCESCEKWLCCKCQQVPKGMLTAIQKWPHLHWYCMECEAISTLRVKVSTTSEPQESTGNLAEIFKTPEISKIVETIAVETASLIVTTIQSDLSKESLKMTASYAKVVKDMSAITGGPPQAWKSTNPFTPAANNETNTPTPSRPQQVVENIDEYLEREKRKLNLIIHNLPESASSDPAARSHHEEENFKKILKDEFRLTGVQVEKYVRLGRPNVERPRPRLLLVVLKDFQSKREILRKAKDLRDSTTWGNIYISPDLTPKERELNKSLRMELRERKQNGETDIIIRRGQIVSRDVRAAGRQEQLRQSIPSPAATTTLAAEEQEDGRSH